MGYCSRACLADGRVYTGKQAQQLGLVDEIGNYYDALEAAGKLIGVNGIPEIKENKRQNRGRFCLNHV